ncbi:MAG: metallophosphoesterase [Lachnospiraceae bacterium]|nr:metallophosphoesterase [Lachnospiraceae bacterium]
MIYAMSDIHGCITDLQKQMEEVDLRGENRLIFLGDYIDYGNSSYQVLKYIWDLQREYGDEKIIVLKGNHEAMLLEWIDDFSGQYSSELEALSYDSWLKTDSQYRFNTFRTFLTEDDFQKFEDFCLKASFVEMNIKAVSMLKENYTEMIGWIAKMPSFFETDTQIYVHAGVDEDAGEYWKWGTSDDIFLWKFPASFGRFEKDVIAGHTGTSGLAHESNYHDVYYDGMSHYYIDGSVYKHGKLLLLAFDEHDGKYYQIENGKMIPVRPFDKYR